MRFNRVSEKVPVVKVPEKVWEALVQSQVRLNRVPGEVQQGSREGSGEGVEGLGAKRSQGQQGSAEGSREGSGEGSQEGLGGFGAEPGQIQPGSG